LAGLVAAIGPSYDRIYFPLNIIIMVSGLYYLAKTMQKTALGFYYQ
jgi:hypothetical protein